MRKITGKAFGLLALCMLTAVPASADDVVIINPVPDAYTETIQADSTLEEASNIRTPAGMYIGPRNVGNMTREEVGAAIDSLIDELSSKSIKIKSSKGTTEIPLSGMNITCTNKEMLMVTALGEHGYGNLIQQYKQDKDTEHNGLYFEPEYSANASTIVEYLLTQMPELESKPQNASVTKGEDGKFKVIASVPGFTIDYDATYEAVLKSIREYDGKTLKSVEVAGTESKAVYDDSIFEGFGAALGSWTTSYDRTGAQTIQNRASNIEVAAEKVNGTVLMPGDEFSFCAALTPMTEENGFKEAGTIMDGNTVDALGGGVCQVSSTLFNAVLYSELEVTFRRPHSKRVTYVDPGLDAMVYVLRGQDFRFMNSTDHAIYIEAVTERSYQGDANKGSITFTIYGTEYREPGRTIWYEGIADSVQWIEAEEGKGIGPYELNFDDEKYAAAGEVDTDKPYMGVTSYPSPRVTAKVIKHVYMNGEEVSAAVESWSRAYYNGHIGKIWFNSNTVVKAIEFDPDTMIITDITIVPKKEATDPTKKTTKDDTDQTTKSSEKETTETETEKETKPEETPEPPTEPHTEPSTDPTEPHTEPSTEPSVEQTEPSPEAPPETPGEEQQ
ncbi:MAG: VanW family protein [Lachnospiraceae bacterium]|nr:VanW family protein [Lachnospiraceae bacterium]